MTKLLVVGFTKLIRLRSTNSTSCISSTSSKKGIGLRFSLALVCFLSACAGPQKTSQGPLEGESDVDPQSNSAEANSEPIKGGQKLAEPGELDKLLDAKPMPMATMKSAAHGATISSQKVAEPASGVKGKFRIQIAAESDMDAAQIKKGTYEKQLGGTVDVVFDAPYYKLRWGYFESKQDAEDKLLELSDQKIQGFVVK